MQNDPSDNDPGVSNRKMKQRIYCSSTPVFASPARIVRNRAGLRSSDRSILDAV